MRARSRFVSLEMKGALYLPAVLALALLASPSHAQDPDPDQIYQPTNEDAFRVVATNGISGPDNTGAASMQWFKGNLYVGTSRASHCVTLASVAGALPVNLYPLLGPNCPLDAADLPLAAEIWRYRPATGQWDKVYTSPLDIPVRFDLQNRPTKFTARDIAFPSMATVKEPGGHEALYVGGMSPAGVFPGVFGTNPPPPRLLRTLDGDIGTWQVVPNNPGTLLGDLGKGLPGSLIKPVMFEALVGYRGRLFGAVGDALGYNALLVSSQPASGNDAWTLGGPLPETFPVSSLAVYNDFLYCAVAGLDGGPYRIFKAAAAGAAPLAFTPVLTGATSWRAVSLTEFNGRLYVGTGIPPELVRIDADDSWEIIVGSPRLVDSDLKRPLSGVSLGLGSAFSSQFRALTAHEGRLYLGVSDWSQVLEIAPQVGDMLQYEFGFDLFRSDDGISWVPVTRNGFGVDHQPIPRTMASTPAGLFVGSASSSAGLQVWQKDATTQSAAAAAPAPPQRVEAVSEQVDDQIVVVSWERSPGASQYRVYRSTVTPVLDVLDGVLPADALLALLQNMCDAVPLVCALVNALQSDLGVPGPFMSVGTTPELFFLDARTSALPALYFVRAEDAGGGLSAVSNMAGGPSHAAFISFPLVGARLEAANQSRPAKSRMRIQKLFQRALAAARAGNTAGTDRLLGAAERGLKQGPIAQRLAGTEVQDLTYFLHGLERNMWLGEQDLIPVDAVLDGVN